MKKINNSLYYVSPASLHKKKIIINPAVTNVPVSMATVPVSVATEPVSVATEPVSVATEPVSAASVSESIEDTKTPTQKSRKQRITSIQSREQRPGETNHDFTQRIKNLDNQKLNRAKLRNKNAELSAMIEAYYNVRLSKLSNDSKALQQVSSPIKSTKL